MVNISDATQTSNVQRGSLYQFSILLRSWCRRPEVELALNCQLSIFYIWSLLKQQKRPHKISRGLSETLKLPSSLSLLDILLNMFNHLDINIWNDLDGFVHITYFNVYWLIKAKKQRNIPFRRVRWSLEWLTDDWTISTFISFISKESDGLSLIYLEYYKKQIVNGEWW